eukprot:TRINITY_DN871_c0_g1_i1.p1 TRINITY_DN871_c0_g1~~TRINITY_DN871_c0_g1_i1.p1  ORF type:complete len:207 (+),score=19.34 TRINITY_DN871_c0_g1_i1:166-786(+)
MSSEAFDGVYKVVVIGDGGVGKTSMLNRFVDNTFSVNVGPTGGQDFKSKLVTIDGKQVKLNIWDTAGQDTTALLTRSYYKEAKGAVLVFDLGEDRTLSNLYNWLEDLNRYAEMEQVKILVGNKNDIEERSVRADEGKRFANDHQLTYMESSAKTGENIENVFSTLARSMHTKFRGRHQQELEPDTLNIASNPTDTPGGKKRRCEIH